MIIVITIVIIITKVDIIKYIDANKDLRKIFGERELIIIKKQLLGVRMTPSEKTRLSRDIRKKFEVMKSLQEYNEYFELKHGALAKKLIDRVVETIKNHEWFHKIDEIILFGSYVEGRFHMFSDIDIAVKFKEKISDNDSIEFRKRVFSNLPDKVDIQVYNTLPDKIKKEIDKNGRRIYKRPDK